VTVPTKPVEMATVGTMVATEVDIIEWADTGTIR
jgi:hypothetical protein